MFICVGLGSAASAADADWRALVEDAYKRADLVVSGTVTSVNDQTAVDGGHIYGLELTGQQKGAPESQLQVRAGGFFYLVSLEAGDEVMLFLRSTSDKSQPYALVEAEGLRPMAFRVSGADARPVDDRLDSIFASVTVADLNGLLSSIEP